VSSSEDSLLLSSVAVRCLTLSSSVFFYHASFAAWDILVLVLFYVFKLCNIFIYHIHIIQLRKENPGVQIAPPMKVKTLVDVTEDAVNTTLRRAVGFLSSIQTHDGHWTGDIGGLLFTMPHFVSFALLLYFLFFIIIIFFYISINGKPFKKKILSCELLLLDISG
jgi:hypothetical protein